ncbi:MAG TPA: TAXI family TRAP transporter solute-binding subunit [Verrucomicrobiae bacterium]|nr:TAXI family TRAP transporter solute-binding subunit [Verrucomicrobiae bacterium]
MAGYKPAIMTSRHPIERNDSMTPQRYNSAIQRVKGFLELASGLYDTSLSYQTQRAAEGVLQTDSRLGYYLQLSLLPRGKQGECISLAFAADSFRELKLLAEGKVSVAWINPSASVTLAYKGTGPLPGRLPLRAIAVFPSWDVMGFAVQESSGITSLEQIKKERVPIHLSTGPVGQRDLLESPVTFMVSAAMKAAGFTFADIRKWGGKIQTVSRPSHPDRREGIEKGTVNAVFDEGIKSWGQTVLDHGFRYLPIEGAMLSRLKALGYRAGVVPKSHFKGLIADVPTIDFSGWPMVVRADMPNDVAYALCEAIELRQKSIPTDNYRPLSIADLCANNEEAPYDVPLHPGARKFYRERGYLK